MRLNSAFRAALLGPAYVAHRKLIASSKTWTSAQAQAYGASRLSKLVRQYGDAIRTKDDYRAEPSRYTPVSLPILTNRVTTGGTTGTPFSFHRNTFAQRQKERAYIFDIWSEVGYAPFDLRVIYRGNIVRQLISYNWLENAYTISPNQLTQDTIEQVANFLSGLPPFFLHVYPSSLFTLTRLLGTRFIRGLPLRGILAGSEAFPSSQIAKVEHDLGTRITHWYGHSEYATLAKYCHDCRGFHFYPTYGYTEFEGTREGLHRIIATSYNAVGTRFIRYDTGDLAKLSNTTCRHPFLRIDSIVGRTQEYFIGRDGIRYAFGPFLFGIHNKFWDLIDTIQFVQRSTGTMLVRVDFKPDITQVDKDWVRDLLSSRFSTVELTFSSGEYIEKTRAGKHRYYINELETRA